MYRTNSVINHVTPFLPCMSLSERYTVWLLGLKRKSLSSARSSSVRYANRRLYTTKAAAEPFLNGSSSSYVEEMYNSWLEDPKSVHVVRIRTFINILIKLFKIFE